MFSLLQAFNHLHQRFRGEAASHQGARSQLNIVDTKIALIVTFNVIFFSSFYFTIILFYFMFFFPFSRMNVHAEHLYVFQC